MKKSYIEPEFELRQIMQQESVAFLSSETPDESNADVIEPF